MKKRFALLLILILTASSVVLVTPAHSLTNSSVPEFTLKYVDASFDVPPATISSTDPYTNKTTTTTIPGRHVENKTIEATIKNPPGASYYNFRYKGHYTEKWNYDPFNPDSGSTAYTLGDTFSVPFQASASDYTILSLDFLPQSIPVDGKVDVQVQALFGNFDAIPYVHIIDVGGPTYDFIFKGTTSDWSTTQTITFGTNISTPTSSTLPPQNTTASSTSNSDSQNVSVLGLDLSQVVMLTLLGVIAVLLVVVAVYFRRKKQNARLV